MNEEYSDRIGRLLVLAREEKGFSVDFVSNALKINPDYIRALESGDRSVFPAEVFLKGFLKNYAHFLGLDGDGFVAVYNELVRGAENKTEEPRPAATPPARKKPRKKMPLKYIVLAGIALLVLFSWLRVVQVKYTTESELEKRKSSGFKALTTSKELALHEEKKRILGTLGGDRDIVVVKAYEDCWMEIRYEDTKIFQGLLLGGEEREFSYKKGMIVKLGNAGGTELVVKGAKRTDLGRKGEVKEIVIE